MSKKLASTHREITSIPMIYIDTNLAISTLEELPCEGGTT